MDWRPPPLLSPGPGSQQPFPPSLPGGSGRGLCRRQTPVLRRSGTATRPASFCPLPSPMGRYTHRVAISNRRLLKLEDGQVSFQWKDYRDGNRSKVMTVSAEEFTRRFLQHALPARFQRIRYYGFLANCHRAEKLDLCRQLLATVC